MERSIDGEVIASTFDESAARRSLAEMVSRRLNAWLKTISMWLYFSIQSPG